MQDEKLFYDILAFELEKALGCTEPIAIAYTAAVARRALGKVPQKAMVRCSGNIIKNAKSVYVPMAGHLKGIDAACLIGAIGGNPDRKLEVLRDVTEEDVALVDTLLQQHICEIEQLRTTDRLHIIVELEADGDKAVAAVRHTHTGLYLLTRNDEVLFQEEETQGGSSKEPDYSILNVESILQFAAEIDFDNSEYGRAIQSLIETQIACNGAIAREGLENPYGANIGKTLLRNNEDNVKVRAKAYAAAGSDARMNGCDLPVVINSGSGNQGITVSLPVIEYAEYLQASHEQLLRALVISNLTAIYQKCNIGRLSAYCGVVSAAAGAGAGITYLKGGTIDQIKSTIINTLENISGIVCDGAGESCAAKIASSVDAAIMGSDMALDGVTFSNNDGLVKQSLQETLDGIIKLAKEGMKETDEVILDIMIH